MKKLSLITVAAFAIWGMAMLYACNSDDEAGPTEFIASSDDFEGFMSWPSLTTTGDNPALQGMAHVPDETAIRDIYFKDGQDPEDGEYPIGTIIVKHSHDGEDVDDEFTAMIKRGNNFNPDNNDWEWFMLMSDGVIMDRGADLMDGMCGSCHNSSAATDFVFTK